MRSVQQAGRWQPAGPERTRSASVRRAAAAEAAAGGTGLPELTR
jgi:hypothetical protein